MTYRIPQMSKVGKYYAPESEPKRCLAFSDGLSSLLLASGDEKGKLFVWNAMNRTVRNTMELHEVRLAALMCKLLNVKDSITLVWTIYFFQNAFLFMISQ